MLKIGEFAILSKTSIKTLRYYEKEGLLKPSYIDRDTLYRYYDISKLKEISNILNLRSLGLSIKDIKTILDGGDVNKYLEKRYSELEKDIKTFNNQLQRIKSILEEKNMNQEIVLRTLPKCIVYYREAVVKDFGHITEFVLETGAIVRKENPTLKCSPLDYCFITYLDGKPNGKDIKIRYSEAVVEKGNESKEIKFEELPEVKALSIQHKGAYCNLGKSYDAILNYMEKNGYKMASFPREVYIDGCWNKEKEEDYLTEIQIPIE